ncbi:DNA polymerase epsilon catalytic subunit A [Artemisia annua]|uniref:DNA polymerase epsilon catalytic subunit n=1 Tax=Artemisia annua TaxID=35608 RepID=A0A2U1MFK5_ARTAN|nr:DNA polymerase epsilon catalytic subunit A [Artemisia annua]
MHGSKGFGDSGNGVKKGGGKKIRIIGWQVPAAKLGLQRCDGSSRWLNERVSLSRYFHVPLGNFEQDWVIHIANIFFARALRDQQQIVSILCVPLSIYAMIGGRSSVGSTKSGALEKGIDMKANGTSKPSSLVSLFDQACN